MIGDYELVVGLEVHCQINTESKMFSACAFEYGAAPNSQVDPYSLGMPGTLPVANAKVVKAAVQLALALGCRVQTNSRFARKHYFYPDLPKGYQITQADEPYALGGAVNIEIDGKVRTIPLTRIHIEEDAGKNTHVADRSLLDFNRAGAPLVEIVSEPALRSAVEAVAYLRELRTMIRHLRISAANMEEGTLRCDANVSLRSPGSMTLGTRCEIKNLNSFKFLEAAILAESRRQRDLLDAGEAVIMGTMAYDDQRDRTWMMRTKEGGADYRYYSEPDLPPLVLEPRWVESLQAQLPELPAARRLRYRSAGLSARDSAVLIADPNLCVYFDRCLRSGLPVKKVCNWVTGELRAQLSNAQKSVADSAVSPENLASLVAMVEAGTVSNSAAKKVLQAMMAEGAEAETIVEREGLSQISDSAEIAAIVEDVLADFPRQVEEFRAGKTKVRGFLFGKCMVRSAGRANPRIVNEVLDRNLCGRGERASRTSDRGPTNDRFCKIMNDPRIKLRPVTLSKDQKRLRLLDQRALPGEERWLELDRLDEIAMAIETLTVRGAPAIGCAAALGLYVLSLQFPDAPDRFRLAFSAAAQRLAATRPTAVNLFVAIDQQRRVVEAAEITEHASRLREALRARALAHLQADVDACLAIGAHGGPLLPVTGGVLTHCNAGGLATAAYGTALGVIRNAWSSGKTIEVYADETRPLLQGARLTAWELQREGIPVRVIADNMAGALMAQGRIQAAVVGADRITRNGDVANKIGTYTVAVLCKFHKIPLYVAAPTTTIDLSLHSGSEIPIEQRDGDELRVHGGQRMTPAEIPVENPAFDVTPAALIDKIITEHGVFEPERLAEALEGLKSSA